eukprot:Skav229971  [mRNA]  locus=scaffold327:557669:562837:- [translate_table: standard]
MPEYHPGTDIEIQSGVPSSGFRNAIPNTKRYMKHNLVDVKAVCEASYTGDYGKLQEMLATGDEKTLFNGDLNGFVNNIDGVANGRHVRTDGVRGAVAESQGGSSREGEHELWKRS